MKSIYEFLLSEHLLNEHLLKSKTAVSTQDADCVDLGLQSGLLWAKCNIGAKAPTDYGDYFMWGSTEPDTDKPCDWKHAPFNNDNDDYDCDSDYFESIKNKVCPNGILAPEYDAATAILGDDWRLPTKADFNELIDNTEHEWIKNYKGSEINGMRFTPKNSKAAKANGAELFIPASGYRDRDIFYNRGSSTYLWSSSINASRPKPTCAWLLYFSYSSCSMNSYLRCYGFCLRGVKNK